MDDLISRQAAIDAIANFVPYAICDESTESYTNGLTDAYNLILQLPSAQPEPQWIPVKPRPMDEEERKEWSEKIGYDLADDEAVIYSNLPDDGQECIVCTKWGNVFIDTFLNDSDYGCAFEEHGDMDGITAWMPVPKPWKEGNG